MIKSVVIGSVPLAKRSHNYSVPYRDTNDIDILLKKIDFRDYLEGLGLSNVNLLKVDEHKALIKLDTGTKLEVFFIENHPAFEEIYNDFGNDPMTYYAFNKQLYSLKKAHIHQPNLKFDKHILDFIYLRKIILNLTYNRSFELSDSNDLADQFSELTLLHKEDVEKRLGKIKTPKLYQKDVNEFFEQSKNSVKSYYVHDDMHIAMAHYNNRPAYELMQKDKTKADCSKKLWDEMPLKFKRYCVLEEAYVIALERKILPQMFGDIPVKYTPLDAFKWALKRICTNLCSGWFRWFATINYEEILKMYDPEYIKRFIINIEKVKNGNREK